MVMVVRTSVCINMSKEVEVYLVELYCCSTRYVRVVYRDFMYSSSSVFDTGVLLSVRCTGVVLVTSLL